MRLDARNFTPRVQRSGIHTVELVLDTMRYRLTETEARTLANELLKLVDPQENS